MTADRDGAQTRARRVEATPEKRFFVSMLVKDIELIPAIVDLVDNSIDGAKRLRPVPPMSGTQGLRSTSLSTLVVSRSPTIAAALTWITLVGMRFGSAVPRTCRACSERSASSESG